MENTQKMSELTFSNWISVARGNIHINREPQANSSKKEQLFTFVATCHTNDAIISGKVRFNLLDPSIHDV